MDEETLGLRVVCLAQYQPPRIDNHHSQMATVILSLILIPHRQKLTFV